MFRKKKTRKKKLPKTQEVILLPIWKQKTHSSCFVLRVAYLSVVYGCLSRCCSTVQPCALNCWKKKKKNGGFRSRWRRYLPGDTGRMKFPLKKKYLEPLFNSGKYRYREIRIPDFYPVMFLVMSGDGTFTPWLTANCRQVPSLTFRCPIVVVLCCYFGRLSQTTWL